MTSLISKRPICLFLAIATMANSGIAATYIKPDESKELFKLEKIPLQVDSMKELAKHMVILARRKQQTTPANQRTTGQLLALAIRLDPANQDAREINQAMGKKQPPQESPESKVNTSKARVLFFKGWLANPDAGVDANLLSNYLSDATKTLQDDTVNNDDLGNWTGILPPLKKYGNSHTPRPPKGDRTPMRETDKGNTSDIPKPTSDFHLKEQAVTSPFALETSIKYRDPKRPGEELYRTNRFIKTSTIQLQLTPCEPEEKNRLSISSIANRNLENRPVFSGVAKTLYVLFTRRHSGLPHYQSKVIISNGHYSLSNGLALTAPVALMFESSIANTPLRKDLHICAVINGEGKLSQPDNFWEMLTSLRQSTTGGRLVVSSASAKLMIQVLVYGQPDFFTRWEVFSADTLDEALAVSTQKSAADLAKASQIFDSIRNLAKKTAVTKLAVNRSIRSRLADIIKLAPNHASAKILYLQGSGKRPMRLSELALAHELLPVIRSMNTTLKYKINPYNISTSSLKRIHESTRESLDKLERLIDRSHNDLYEESLHLANDFRSLKIIARRDNDVDDDYKKETKKVKSLYYTMLRQSNDLLARTLVTAGFPAPEKPKKEE